MNVLGVRHTVSCTASALQKTARATATGNRIHKHRTKSTRSSLVSYADNPDQTPQASTSALDSNLDIGGGSRDRWASLHEPPLKISTLVKSRLTRNDFLVLSNRKIGLVRTYPGMFANNLTHLNLHPSGMDYLIFPEHARGFLYYYLPLNAPALSGQIRFRVTGKNDPALFSSGEDLLRSDHLPWRNPIVPISFRKSYQALRRRLLEDALVSEDVLRVASSLPPDAKMINVGSTRMVHAFGQPFLLNFGQTNQYFYLVGADTIIRASPMIWRLVPGRPLMKGSALCCFEKSTRPEHAGRRVVVCRVVRILEPLEAIGLSPVPDELVPREGELIRTCFADGSFSRGWTFDVDRLLALRPDTRGGKFGAGLDLLYDNEARAGGPVGW